MKQKNIIITGVVILAVVAAGAWLFFNKGNVWQGLKQEVSMDDPIDIVFDFYNPWLDALQSASADPYKLGLANAPILSKELRDRLLNAEGHPTTEPDPVLCQTETPTGISVRTIYKHEDETQILVTSKQKELTGQATITLLQHNGGWYMSDIHCSPGEFSAPREFSFEREGFLLKSVVPPLDSQYWHLVFEENNEKGHTAPLFFSSQSMCQMPDGSTVVCNPDQFVEPAKAVVHGEMTESGVEVKRIELLGE